MTLAGLRSRWMTSRSCAAASPAQICRAISSARSSGNRPTRLSSDDEILAVDVLHRQERRAVDLVDVVDAADVGVRDLPRHPHFGVELRQSCRILDRHRAAGTSARPADRASGRRRDRPRPCRRGRAARRCGSGRRGACPARSGRGRWRQRKRASRWTTMVGSPWSSRCDDRAGDSLSTAPRQLPGASRVASSMPGRSCGIDGLDLRTAAGASGTWGRRSPASCGTMTAAQVGQERCSALFDRIISAIRVDSRQSSAGRREAGRRATRRSRTRAGRRRAGLAQSAAGA